MASIVLVLVIAISAAKEIPCWVAELPKRRIESMNKEKFTHTKLVALLPLAMLLLLSATVVAQTKVQGVIDGRSGPTMSLKTVNSPPDTTVLLTDTTDVGEVEGLFHGRTKQMPMTALIPGLPSRSAAARTPRTRSSPTASSLKAPTSKPPWTRKPASNPLSRK